MKIYIPPKTVMKNSVIEMQSGFEVETDDYKLLPKTTYVIHPDKTISEKTDDFKLSESVGSFRTDEMGKVIVFALDGETFIFKCLDEIWKPPELPEVVIAHLTMRPVCKYDHDFRDDDYICEGCGELITRQEHGKDE